VYKMSSPGGYDPHIPPVDTPLSPVYGSRPQLLFIVYDND